MAKTQVRGTQVLDGTVGRSDLDSTTVGQAVIKKLVQGTNVSLSSTGADAGTGDVTISVPLTTGPQGPQGPQGNTGATGAPGSTGATGPGVPAGGSVGAMLRKRTATDFDTVWLPFATAQGALASNPAVTGATAKMFGVGQLFTPTATGKVLVMLNTQLQTSGGFVAQMTLRYGTGAAPANGAAAAGTNVGNVYQTIAGATSDGVTLCAIITGLTVGVQYWFDFSGAGTNVGATTTAVLPVFSIAELP
jgi:hypothetical protein